MKYYLEITERLDINADNLTPRQIEELDALYEQLDLARDELYDRMLLYTGMYLTPVQARRWFLYFKLGSIKEVAKEEGVSTAAVSKSLIGTNANEKSKTRMRSPVDKLSEIVHADVKIQLLLATIRGLSVAINEIIEENI
jgi:hypothetical protein